MWGSLLGVRNDFRIRLYARNVLIVQSPGNSKARARGLRVANHFRMLFQDEVDDARHVGDSDFPLGFLSRWF